MKLHLGCGERRIEGYLNIDSRLTDAVDIVDDVRFLKRFKEESADIIYVCHVLEHFSLKKWRHTILNLERLGNCRGFCMGAKITLRIIIAGVGTLRN